MDQIADNAGMLTAYRSESYITENSFAPAVIPNPVNSYISNAKSLTVFMAGHELTMNVLSHAWDEPKLLISDNGGLPYCKLNAVICLSETVAADKEWHSTIEYSID